MALCNKKRDRLDFTAYGEGFPSGRDDGWFAFQSSVDQYMYVDLNDGTDVKRLKLNANNYTKIATIQNTDSRYNPDDTVPSTGGLIYNALTYEDLNTNDRLVSVWFDDKASITDVSIYLVFHLKEEFPPGILSYTNIESFRLGYATYMTKLPSDLITLTKMKTLAIIANFSQSGSKYMEDYIPIGFFNMSLTDLTASGIKLGVAIEDGRSSNLEYVHLLKDTLTRLQISGTYMRDSSYTEEISNAIKSCTKVISLSVDSTYSTYPPLFINEMSQLTYLRVGGGYNYNNTFDTWGDLSNLTNLKTFLVDVTTSAPTSIPPYLKDMTSLIKWSLHGTYQNQTRWDEWIVNLYTYMENNIPFNDPNNSLRGLRIEASRSNDTYIVQGTYQQPQGYVQNSSNGTPTTQLEKLWVLQNQYNITVQYSDNRP